VSETEIEGVKSEYKGVEGSGELVVFGACVGQATLETHPGQLRGTVNLA